MKKKLALLFICCSCFYFHQLPAQNVKIDSLLKSLNASAEDTIRVNTLNQLCRDYNTAGELEKAKKCSDDALRLSEKLGFTPGVVSAHLNMGNSVFYGGDFNLALEKYKLALAASEKGDYKKGIANSHNNIGLALTYQQKYAQALEHHHTALSTFEQLKDTSGMSKSYNNIGIINEEKGNYTEALASYFACLRIAEKHGDLKGAADGYFNIANVYSGSKRHIEAIRYYQLSLSQYKQLEFQQGIGLSYMNMGQAYQELGKLDSAESFMQKGFEILEDIGNKSSAAKAKNGLGHLHTKLGNYSRALEDFTTALKLFQENNDTLHMSTSYRGFGEVYFHRGEYHEALKYFSTSLALAKAVGYKLNIAGGYGSLAEVYEKQSDFKNAYLNYKLYFIYNDSLVNESKGEQIAEMQTRFETEKKDNEIILLNKDKEIRDVEIIKQKQLKYSFIGGLGLVIVLLLFGYRTYRVQQSLRLQDIRNKIAGDLHDDIGSTLNSISIYSEVAKKKDANQDEALEMIGDASRKIIDAMSDIVWTVNPDNDSFAKIIFRMKSLAYNLFRAKQIEFTFHSDEILNEKKLSLEERRNFYLIFKEAVNNLVKYSNATRAAITLVNENGFIKLRIQDDGVGFDISQDNVGNGLKNMKRRADEMKAAFKVESSKGNGTLIELILKA